MRASNVNQKTVGLRDSATLRRGAIAMIIVAAMVASLLFVQKSAADEVIESNWTITSILEGARNGDETALRLADEYADIIACGFNRSASGQKSGCDSPLGLCDNPFYRDLFVWDSTMPTIYVRLWFHILALDDGSNPVCTEQDLINRVNDINQIYAPLGIQFLWDYSIDSSSQYYSGISCGDNQCTGFFPMRTALAIDPANYLNVYVSASAASFGTWPAWSNTFTATGGINMNLAHMTDSTSWYNILHHEIGHNLGLWHTFEGADPNITIVCTWQCRENMATGPGSYRGDMCYDTPPQTRFFQCPSEAVTDPCTGLPWGPASPENIMSYAICHDTFTEQQARRMRCTAADFLAAAHVINPALSTDVSFGSDSLTVSFTVQASSIDTVSAWSWEFGDGNGSSVQNPTHTYTIPGTFGPVVSMTTSQGTFGAKRPGAVLIESDTITGGFGEAYAGNSVRYDITVHNFVPTVDMIIPISWSGSMDIVFDSVSNDGLRSQSLTNLQALVSDTANNRMVYRVQAKDGDPFLAPDTGAVLSLWFTLPPDADKTDTVAVAYTPQLGFNPRFTTIPNQYQPDALNGIIRIKQCLAGDIDASGGDPDIADLTYLVSFMFKGGPPPPEPTLADVNFDSSIDVADLTYLVSYMFKSGPEPVCL